MDHESEAIERLALEDLQRAASPAMRRKLCLRGVEIGSAFISVAGGLPPSAIVINRSLGIGLDEEAREADLQAMVAVYREADVGRFFIQVHPDARPPVLADWLESAGLGRARAWQKFSRASAPLKPPACDFELRTVGPEYGEAFGRIACAGFDLGEQAVPWLAALAGRENWHILMSFDGGEPAGAGALFVQDDLGWLDFAATRPACRRRGSQAALLAARINLANELGCRQLFTCTGEAVPGDPQHSYGNIVKAGFETSCLRANYAP